jgi:hypothetical protein
MSTEVERPSIVFLFGAGASYGAQGIEPFPPPLGGGLYGELKREFPETWGALHDDEVERFGPEGTQFEAGMKMLWEKWDERAWKALIDVGVYFSRFRPPRDQSDCYSRLIIALRALGFVDFVRVATLNYECLLEVASSRVGVGLNYSGRPNPGALAIAKPHGSCNFLADVNFKNVTLIGSPEMQNLLLAPLQILDPDEIEPTYRSEYSVPPAMSLYAVGKHTPIDGGLVAEMREDWRRWVAEASLIVVIGAQPYFRDDHIWNPIVSSPVDVWYIGGGERNADFGRFDAALGPRLTHLGTRFDESLKPLLERLRDFRDGALVLS